jgi:hypothetical protein
MPLQLQKQFDPPAEATFKSRVESFWEWFAANASRFYRMLEEDQDGASSWSSSPAAAELSARMDELLPGFACVFGPGERGYGEPGRSFTLSGEGVLQRQLLALYWASRAPRLDGWTFYASRQPSPPELIETMRMDFEGQELNPLEFWLTPAIDDEEEVVDLTVWHPLYAGVNEDEARLGAFFIFLDEVLGEYGTGQWIGSVTPSDKQLADAIPLTELWGFIDKLESEKGWQKLPPGDVAVVYEREDPENRFLRDDVFVGSTALYELIVDYYEAEGDLEDPLAGTGADYVFVSMDVQFLPEGQQMETRDIIENALEAALKSEQSGRVLGGAFGTQFAYLDLMLFDRQNSVQIVERVLREQNLPAGTAINFFAREKLSQRVVL